LIRCGLLKRECCGDLDVNGGHWGRYSAKALLGERRIEDQIQLAFQRVDWDFESRQTIRLSWARNPFTGTGYRAFFLCDCGKRACFLYLPRGSQWQCRGCLELISEGEIATPRQRAVRRARRIRMHLGGSGDIDEPFPPCPRGMHRDAYARWRLRAARYEAIARTIKGRRTREQMRAARLRYGSI
jgi:hypothetical protein